MNKEQLEYVLNQGLKDLNITNSTVGTIGIKTPVEIVGYEVEEAGNSNREIRSLRL